MTPQGPAGDEKRADWGGKESVTGRHFLKIYQTSHQADMSSQGVDGKERAGNVIKGISFEEKTAAGMDN